MLKYKKIKKKSHKSNQSTPRYLCLWLNSITLLLLAIFLLTISILIQKLDIKVGPTNLKLRYFHSLPLLALGIILMVVSMFGLVSF